MWACRDKHDCSLFPSAACQALILAHMCLEWDAEGGKNEGEDWEGDGGMGRLLTSSILAALLSAVGPASAAPAGGAAEKQRPKNEVKQGQAYKEETRKIIMSLDKIRKVGRQGVEGVGK